MSVTPTTMRVLLYGAAVLSGGATLVYELVLMRALTPAIGATWPAISVVLAGFMAGLGLGAVGGGFLAERSRPLLAYVGVEVLIAGGALAFPLLAEGLMQVPVGALGRAALAGLCMLPATSLMGATFPLLSRALHAGDAHGRHVPWLYAANTLGAFGGTLLGGLMLPFWLGLRGALWAAVLANLTAAALAALAWIGGARAVAVTDTPVAVVEAPRTEGRREGLPLAVMAFGAGFLVMACELFWTRSALQLDPHTYSGWLTGPEEVMTVILALVLLGNAVGALGAARWSGGSPRRAARALGWSWAGAAVLSLLALEWFSVQALGLHRLNWLDWPRWVGPARLLPLVLPAAFLGFSFPMLARLYAGHLAEHGPRMGVIWAVNTLGSVLGSVAGGWLLLPLLGTGRGLVLCALLAVLLGGLALWRLGAVPREAGDGALGVGLLLALAWVLGVGAWVPLAPGQWFALRYGSDAVLASWEGWDSSTVVVDTLEGRVMGTNGRLLLEGAVQERAERLRGLAEGASSVLVVGFGTGSFPAAILQEDDVLSMHVVDIDPWQFSAAPWFHTEVVLRDPRVEAITDDALHHIARSSTAFDLVIIDSWGPEASPTIYTQEFHARVLERLTPRGVLWAKLSHLHPESLQPVLDAVRCSYPFSATVGPQNNPTAVMGSRTALRQIPGMQRLSLMAQHTHPCDPLSLQYPRRLRRLVLP